MINEKDKIIINPVEIFRGYLEVFNLTIEDFCYGVCNIVSPATKKMYDSHHEWWVKKIHKLLNGEINIDDHYDWIFTRCFKNKRGMWLQLQRIYCDDIGDIEQSKGIDLILQHIKRRLEIDEWLERK